MKAMQLVSESHLKFFRSLTSKKHREHEKKFLIEGTHLLKEALNSEWQIETILLTRNSLRNEEVVFLLQQANRKNIELFELKERDLNALVDTVTPQGIVGVVAQQQTTLEQFWNDIKDPTLVVALDNISDPGNAGSIFRTCDWFGVDAVLLGSNSVELFNPKVIRSTMGSIFHLPIFQDINLHGVVEDAKRKDFRIVATSPDHGKDLGKVTFEHKTILVFGSEAHGVSPEILRQANELLTIPKYGKAESLNVAIACGVVLSSWRREK